MEESSVFGQDLPMPPARLFERLAQFPGYTWDQSSDPFHSSYDHWRVKGIRHTPETDASNSHTNTTSSIRSGSARSSPKLDSRPFFRHHWSSISDAGSDVSSRLDLEATYIPVVARVSTHTLRLEREYNYNKHVIQTLDPDCKHTVRPIEILRLSSRPDDAGPILVSIYEAPGPNYLRAFLNLGPAFYSVRGGLGSAVTPTEQIPLEPFLDFAIGACECLELIHFGHKAIHGEVRADAFHFNRETGNVKIINSGNGPKAFENLLSSEGWSTASRELGVKNKLQFIAPEQTSRLPAEPDSRTDIYSLGVLLWVMLVGKPAFDATSPIDMIQKVLSTRLPLVSSQRIDIPDVVSLIIQKMTQKSMDERYHSVTGLKHDLTSVARLLGEGDSEGLKTFRIGQKDVSSFFVLPSGLYGRKEEYEKILNVIEKANKQQQSATGRAQARALYSISSNSSISEGRVDSFEIADGSSDSSSQGPKESRSNSTVAPVMQASVLTSISEPRDSVEPHSLSHKPSQLSNQGNYNTDSRASGDTFDRESVMSNGTSNYSQLDSIGPFARKRGSAKLRRRGRCEVISILGSQGVGKSHLVQAVQPVIRRNSYFAVAKFDRARPRPFEPLLKAMGSFFRQVFSEKDVGTPYHESIRTHVRPNWTMLHSMLELPENLLAQVPSSMHVIASRMASDRPSKVETSLKTALSSHSGVSHHHNRGQSSSDFLRGPTATRSLRLMNIFLEVLRVLSSGKMLTMCIDDLHAADEESVELIKNVIKSRIPLVLILSSRDEDGLVANMRNVLEIESTNVMELGPLRESDVFEYVADTMHQDISLVIPLAAVVYEKSGGNAFLMREILETCYRKNCVWYSWKESIWEFDLDRVFTEFAAEETGCLTTNFITKRLYELPPAARAILAWASLLGTTVSFSLIQKLLSGEYLYSTGHDSKDDVTCPKNAKFLLQSESEVIAGLQTLLNNYILIPGDNDDEFEFSHDRYARAANAMRECHNVEKMHYIIAQAMMKHTAVNDTTLHAKARHICLAANTVKMKVNERFRYREVLFQSAQKAAESGGRRTALWYYKTCIFLLQDDKWNVEATDVVYEETLHLHVQAAEVYYLQGHGPEALSLLNETLKYAKTPACKSRSYILQSRILAARGDSGGALEALKTSINELGISIPDSTTWDECDIGYEKIRAKIATQEASSSRLLSQPLSEEQDVVALGAVLAEAISAAFWADSLLFYQMAVVLLRAFFERGAFVQIGLGCSHLAMISIARFKDIEFGLMLGELAQSFLNLYDDTWTRGRGWTIYTLFVGHLQSPLRNHLPILESALEYSLTSGDRLISLINIGAMAYNRLWLGQDMGELEAFCNIAPDEFDGWQNDLRGGCAILSTRQLARVLQGKTRVHSAETVMDDDLHSSREYMSFIAARASSTDQPRNIYWSTALIALYLFGYHEKAVEIGRQLVRTCDNLWTMRAVSTALFYLSLSMLTLCRDEKDDANRKADIQTVKGYKQRIDEMGRVHDVNYAMWSLILSAAIGEVEGSYGQAVTNYEMAMDHCEVHGFAIEEALAYELQGEFMIRRGAKRAGKVAILGAISAWNRINAGGKAHQLADRHEWLLKVGTTTRTMDVGCQTSESLVRVDNNDDAGKEDLTRAWLEPKGSNEPGKTSDVPGLGLDILDMTSILEFSQVISSELQIDKLLAKMTGIILESVGGQAEFAAIVIDSEAQGWCVAATGDQDAGVKTYPDGLPFTDVEDQVAQQITHYILRFREVIFCPNVLDDERFSNVNDAYLARHPTGRAIVAIPIIQADHLMGVIHVEGPPNSFTQRNLIVLNLLTNQVSISLGNALLYRKVRKISASNLSMIESQKRALAQARDAEANAKKAEAEAMHSVKLKEEAAKAKSIFLANVSHELRTPLNGVIGMSELLKGTPLNPEQDGFADSIRVCADTLLTVINDILDFSKLEAGKMKMFTVPLNLRETITEVVRALAYTQEHGLETIEDLELDETQLVLGDPVRLHQIFMNLLSNSYKFTPKGSVTIKARPVQETKDKIKIMCSVADTGIGITKEQLTRLFQPFSQADSSTARSYGGSGLGLSICKAMIEVVLGGKIWLDSTPGVGTTVSFTLTFTKAPKDATTSNMEIVATDPDPMANWSQGSSIGETPSPPRASFCDLSQVPREQIRVCIAEDNPINQKIAISFVKKLGLQCEAYSDGQQAVDALRKYSKEGNPFHLVLMDVQMPVLDGYNATRTIREDEDQHVREVLVIAMTASAIRGDREKCLEAGMNNYLAKPVRAQVLKAMLDNYLNNTPKQAPSPDLLAPDRERAGTKPHNSKENSGERTTSPKPKRRRNKSTELSEIDRNRNHTTSPLRLFEETAEDHSAAEKNETSATEREVSADMSPINGSNGV